MSRAHLVLLPLVFVPVILECGQREPASIVVHLRDGAHPGVRLAVTDLMADLGRLSGTHVRQDQLGAAGTCVDGQIHMVVFDPHAATEDSGPRLGGQEYTIEESRCGASGRWVALRGGGALATQWAIYDLLTRLGIRYFHPEQTYYPPRLVWPEQPIRAREKPAFVRRSMHAHRVHPIELSPPLDAERAQIDIAAYQRRWIDWNVKMRQNWVDGWDPKWVGKYAYERGFPRNVELNLLNAQQGGRPILDPDAPGSEEEQLAAAIDEAMAARDGEPLVSHLQFQYNPSEFTEVDDRATVRRITFIANYVAQKYPGADVFTFNHGTHQRPTPHYGVRFYDLPQFGPASLGVFVHTLMFYDLERSAAGAYGNASFRHLLAWALEQQQVRRVIHYPEASWWLTFDLPVPLFLAPATLEARQRDIDLLRDYLSSDEAQTAGIWGHQLFTSGQEWGYWLIDYCVAQMVWDLDFTYQHCLDDVTATVAGGEQIRAVLGKVVARQVADLRDPSLVGFLAGSDDETEAAAAAGITVHPLPPMPAAVLAWSREEIDDLERKSLAPLRDMASDYHRWADRVQETLPDQGAAQAPWVREIRDGLRMFALRAEHAVAVYEAVIALRRARSTARPGDMLRAASLVTKARGLTDAARRVVRARELEYRYPAALTIAGDEPGTTGALANQTIYPFRYLSRTHRLFYWNRPDSQLTALFARERDRIPMTARIVPVGLPFELALPQGQLRSLVIDWGDGNSSRGGVPRHVYGREGRHRWVAAGRLPSGLPFRYQDDVVVVERRVTFPKGSLRVAEPKGASLLTGLLPGLVLGLGHKDGEPFMIVERLEGHGPPADRGDLWWLRRSGAQSHAARLELPLPGVGTLHVYDAVLAVGAGGGPRERELAVAGALSTRQVVELLVGAGGVDRDGASRLVAQVLGHTRASLPERVTFRIAAQGNESIRPRTAGSYVVRNSQP